MIKRYSRKEMVDIWSSKERYKIWFEIEAHACDAMAKLGKIPILHKIDEIEKITKHDVIAFLD